MLCMRSKLVISIAANLFIELEENSQTFKILFEFPHRNQSMDKLSSGHLLDNSSLTWRFVL